MKLSVLLAAAGIALGAASFAQAGNDSAAAVSSRDNATHAQSGHKSDGLVAKTKRGMHRMGNKIRHAMHRRDARHDTTAMGAGADHDAGRRARMDEAYANWKHRQASSR